MTISWANYVDIESSEAFEAVHTGLAVQLIATPRDQLATCNASEPASLVVSRNSERYDFLPVLDSEQQEERIIGLFHAAQFFNEPAPDDCVRTHFSPLTEEHLIGGDASILDFVTDADARPCRLVLAGARISGLVSLSDLQKLPVRAALFALITGFEITMAEVIRRRCPNDEEWLGLLSNNRQAKIGEEIAKSKASDGFVDQLLFTQFADKSTIIKKSIDLGRSRAMLEKQLGSIEDLRNKLAHANNYAASPGEAREVCSVVRILLDLRKKIAEAGT